MSDVGKINVSFDNVTFNAKSRYGNQNNNSSSSVASIVKQAKQQACGETIEVDLSSSSQIGEEIKKNMELFNVPTEPQKKVKFDKDSDVTSVIKQMIEEANLSKGKVVESSFGESLYVPENYTGNVNVHGLFVDKKGYKSKSDEVISDTNTTVLSDFITPITTDVENDADMKLDMYLKSINNLDSDSDKISDSDKEFILELYSIYNVEWSPNYIDDKRQLDKLGYDTDSFLAIEKVTSDLNPTRYTCYYSDGRYRVFYTDKDIDGQYISTLYNSDGTECISNENGGLLSDYMLSQKNNVYSGHEVLNERVIEPIAPLINSTSATVATSGISIFEGASKFIENVLDTGLIFSTYQRSGAPGENSELDGVFGYDSDKDWNDTMEDVSKNISKGLFDTLYETSIGRDIKDNTFEFDSTRGIMTGLGETIPGIFATLATGGTTAPVTMALVSGYGKGAETASTNGATAEEALNAATLSAVNNGVQWYLGTKVGGSNLNSITKVILDGGLGLGDALVQPAIASIYKDGYYDGNGNYVEFASSDSLLDKYKENFDDSGGVKNVVTNTLMAGAMSGIGEFFGLSKKAFGETDVTNSKTSNVDTVVEGSNKVVNSVKTDLQVDTNSKQYKLLTEEEIMAKVNEYNKLLDSDDRLHNIINNENQGNAVYIPRELGESYSKIRKLEMEINSGKAIIDNSNIDNNMVNNLNDKSNLYLLSDRINTKGNELLEDIVNDIDSLVPISKKLGSELEILLSDDDYVIGIHRTKSPSEDVFINGLINNDDKMQGVVSNSLPDIENTVSLYENNSLLSFVQGVKTINNYKNSKGAYIVKIPKSYLGKGAGEIKPIYSNTSPPKLLPEYIYGYIPYDENGLNTIVKNSNYSDIHNYIDDGYLYDSSVR